MRTQSSKTTVGHSCGWFVLAIPRKNKPTERTRELPQETAARPEAMRPASPSETSERTTARHPCRKPSLAISRKNKHTERTQEIPQQTASRPETTPPTSPCDPSKETPEGHSSPPSNTRKNKITRNEPNKLLKTKRIYPEQNQDTPLPDHLNVPPLPNVTSL
jgi:hypothetical protein